MRPLPIIASVVFVLFTVSTAVAGMSDFNHDGQQDIVFVAPPSASDAQVAIWLMNGITYQQTISLPSVPPFTVLGGTGDITGDGSADLLWHNVATGCITI